MPPAVGLIGAVAGAAVTSATAATLGAIGSSLLGAVVSTGFGLIASAIAPKPKAPNLAGFEVAAQARTSFIRQPITARRMPFGEVILSGPLTFYETTGDDRYHHMVITLGDAPQAPWDGIDIIWLDNEPIFPSQIDGDGNVTGGRFAGKVRIKKHLGGPDQVADADLIAEVDYLDSNFRQRGCAYLYIRVDWDGEVFPNGLPRPRALCRTNTVMDTRDSTRRYTPNAALCQREYMTEDEVGLGYAAGDLDDSFSTASANISDEIVDTAPVGHAIVGVDTGEDELHLAAAGSGSPLRIETGDRVEIFTATGATAPGGTTTGTVYYAIVERLVGESYPDSSETTISLSAGDYTGAAAAAIADGDVDARHGDGIHAAVRLATSHANAIARTGIAITSAGSGQAVLVKTGEPRYAAAGVVETDRIPADVIGDMLSAMAGTLVWAGGRFRIQAGAFTAATLQLDEGDLMGAITVRSKHSRRERFNCVKGLFSPLITVGEATDYPSVIGSGYVTNDGGKKIFADLDLPFTTRPSTAQRLAWIALERHRREFTVPFPGTLKCLRAEPGVTVGLSNARRGWSGKTFEVTGLEDALYPVEGGGEDVPPIRGATLTLREIDATAFDFDPATQETVQRPKPIPPGGNPLSTPAAPANLALASGTAELDVRLDGTVFSRIKVTWTPPANAFVKWTDVRYRKSADSAWRPAGPFPAADGEGYILDVKDGDLYDGAARHLTENGVASDTDSDPATWQSVVAAHQVAGKDADPSDVAGFSAQQTSAGTVSFGWDRITDADRAGYTIKRTPRANPAPWGSQALVSEEEKGTEKTSASVPPGDWIFSIKAVDTSENESANAATFDLVVTNAYNVVSEQTAAPRWPGAATGFYRHGVSGKLIRKSTVSAATPGTLGRLSVADVVATAEYAGAQIDLGFDADGVRVWGDIRAGQPPGVTESAAAHLEIDYRDAADSYDGFENWALGTADFRYLKGKAVLDDGVILEGFGLTADVEEHESVHTNVAVAPGGTTIAFDRTFHEVPRVDTLTPQKSGSAVRIANWDNLTTTSCDVFIFDKDGSDVGGTLSSARFVGP